ncbi:hypothetical protein C4573_07095 [Candidatus Woesearchaeota archaeon]|nr:MAG: hypothetical protein C4573_07095 [Candidatus Woesearchaeota archaeon]
MKVILMSRFWKTTALILGAASLTALLTQEIPHVSNEQSCDIAGLNVEFLPKQYEANTFFAQSAPVGYAIFEMDGATFAKPTNQELTEARQNAAVVIMALR